ncbi:MAG: hypothetical protein SYC29_15535 [Planctomycetota bacterium]|nr:hypothetical protein [Planctomycetota bacterium]
MTISPATLTDLTLSALSGRRIEVRWSAIVAASSTLFQADAGARSTAHCRLRFLIALQLVTARRAMIEAWLQTPSGPRITLRRQPVTCSVRIQGRLLHVDAHLGGRRVLAVSLKSADRVMYARSPLPADAGFAPGACDPPSARLLAAEPDAASA